MGLCSNRHHPQVPQTCLQLTVAYCHSCQAWTVYASRSTQYDDGDQVTDMATEDYLGPFDGVNEAERLAVIHLVDMLRGSGLPWDRGSW